MNWYIAHYVEIHAWFEFACLLTVLLYGITVIIEMIIEFKKKKT